MGLAQELGADQVWNVTEIPAEERVSTLLEETHGRGADMVIDCSGVPATFEESLKLVGAGGVIVEVGAFVDLGTIAVNPSADICSPNISILGVGGETTGSYEPSLSLMAAASERYPLKKIVTHKFALETGEKALRIAQSSEAMQVVFDPTM